MLVFFGFFLSLFVVGNPRLALIMILGCFLFYNWYYTKLVRNSKFLDLSIREFYVFLPLIIDTLIVGIYPNIFLTSIHTSVNNLIELLYF